MGKRLMLVEDEPTLARALSRLLTRAGYEVVIVASCAEARSAGGTFSVGVFDIDLPDGDGIDLAENLRRMALVRRAVFFSGTTIRRQRVRAARLGPFVEKCKGFPELHAAIEGVMKSQQAKVAGDDDSMIGESGVGESAAPPPSGVRGHRIPRP
jgi:two-component system alkaline phosphatase synthesis response regulator PhoP